MWFEVKSFFKSLVRVQRVADGEIKPLLLPDQQAYLEQNMLLLFEQAQLALLRADQQVFKASLLEVEDRVRQYLRTNTTPAQAFLKSVGALANKNIEPSIPSIEQSVRAVQVFRDYWQAEKVERQLGREAIEAEVNVDEE
ncbi:MAG: uroporphyrinogen-III C-methyltransferase [Pseudomonadales bacterium]|nr:uroporphyrinogen-III C-methyltransferase [Pseudomonadales bacterium]